MSTLNTQQFIAPIALEKAYRLLNHGPTTLISAQCGEDRDVMAAAWVKVTVVIDKISHTRTLIEKSGFFAVQIPTAALLKLTVNVGSVSMKDDPNKLTKLKVPLFYQNDFNIPLVQGCAGWMICKLIKEPHNQQTYDLFIGEVVAAWSDTRVFKDGHWHFENADNSLRTIHHVAGGHFYLIGEPADVDFDS